MAAGAVVVLGAPFAMAQPAHAGFSQDEDVAALTFVTTSGATVTCRLEAFHYHDSDGREVFASQASLRNDGVYVPECRGTHRETVAYEDTEGVDRTVTTTGYGTQALDVGVDGVQSNVQVTHRVQFDQCDAAQSASCELTVLTSTK